MARVLTRNLAIRTLASAGWVIGIGIVLAGCPEKADKKQPVSPACSRFGEQCEVGPGKLGTCVRRDNCVGEGCFVCQSQH